MDDYLDYDPEVVELEDYLLIQEAKNAPEDWDGEDDYDKDYLDYDNDFDQYDDDGGSDVSNTQVAVVVRSPTVEEAPQVSPEGVLGVRARKVN